MLTQKGTDISMNIKDAKQELLHTIQIYTHKDAKGRFLMPAVRQRPLLLIGPPGIGKTAIMEQAARECGINLVSYTITHHTRQSAVGLPVVVKKNFQGREYSVTEYTMSEIIASVYEKIEQTGCKEGILFIDEINCVSETLVPTMLQFLQNKTFGTHPVPSGWVIAAAGNPVEYNRSAREFDIVTLDRVKRIDIEPDLDVWKEYACAKGLHPSVLSYLSLKKDHFYHIENTADRTCFVTARGWEDLSAILYGYEDMNFSPDENLIRQYLQDEEIARDFSSYYQLYAKYRQDYQISELLAGSLETSTTDRLCKMASAAPSDERLTVAGLLLDGWNTCFLDFQEKDLFTVALQDTLTQAKNALLHGSTLTDFAEQYRTSLKIRQKNHLLDNAEADRTDDIARILEHCLSDVRKNHISVPSDVIEVLRQALSQTAQERQNAAQQTSLALKNGFSFAENAFGNNSPEILFLISDLSHNPNAMAFIRNFGCEEYFRFNEKLKFQEERQNLLKEIDSVINES